MQLHRNLVKNLLLFKIMVAQNPTPFIIEYAEKFIDTVEFYDEIYPYL